MKSGTLPRDSAWPAGILTLVCVTPEPRGAFQGHAIYGPKVLRSQLGRVGPWRSHPGTKPTWSREGSLVGCDPTTPQAGAFPPPPQTQDRGTKR